MAGYSGETLAEANVKLLAIQTLTVKCAHCPWTVTMAAPDALAEQRAHFPTHGLKRQRLHRRRTLGNFRQVALTDDEKDAIEDEVSRRRRLLGIEVKGDV